MSSSAAPFPTATSARPVLVGELNPFGPSSHYALYPEPVNCAGWRLCHKVMGLTADQYLERFIRINLCSRSWNKRHAELRAFQIMNEQVARGTPVVLLGAKVCSAFGVPYTPFTVMRHLGDSNYVVLPHPSGRCLKWNEPGAYGRARRVLEQAGAL